MTHSRDETVDIASPSAERRYHHGDLRAALIQAARSVIAERGVEDFKVSRCAEIAGVSSAAPYRHFKTAADLLAAVSAQGFEQLAAAMSTALARHPVGSVEALVESGRAYVRFVLSYPELFHLMWGATRKQFQSDAAAECGGACFDVFAQAVEAARRAHGLEHIDFLDIALPLWSSTHGLASLALGEKLDRCGGVDFDALIDRATRRYFAGLMATAPLTQTAPPTQDNSSS